MANYELNASFEASDPAREAELKLQALRISGIAAGEDGLSLKARLEEDIVERAVQVVRSIGGTADCVEC